MRVIGEIKLYHSASQLAFVIYRLGDKEGVVILFVEEVESRLSLVFGQFVRA